MIFRLSASGDAVEPLVDPDRCNGSNFYLRTEGILKNQAFGLNLFNCERTQSFLFLRSEVARSQFAQSNCLPISFDPLDIFFYSQFKGGLVGLKLFLKVYGLANPLACGYLGVLASNCNLFVYFLSDPILRLAFGGEEFSFALSLQGSLYHPLLFAVVGDLARLH